MSPRIRRSAFFVLTGPVAAGLLSGCFPLPGLPGFPGGGDDKGDQSSSSAPSADPGAEDDPVDDAESPDSATTMTFDDGAAIEEGSVAQWADGLIVDDGWTLSSPDTGEGAWGYTTADGTCTAKFWQGQVFDMTAEDDRAASDFLLGALTKADAATLADVGQDGQIGLVTGDNRVVDSRFVSKTEPERSVVIIVRGFAVLKAAVYVVVDCASDQALVVTEEVISKSPIVIG